ncbi:MAG: hypothetical protein ALECFALPRED_004116 [Alectoria fallacina]|uniref:Uncharacterized protein n=1 Tax=Alectoria fallacina TaxID=1903189 RepID=A0A8H3FQ09_9LECA|nr:MAG: hypothetical protein ALECFALPRED_004116 [Alectoria fallacina]
MPFLFFHLAGEIRNQILRLLLTHTTPILTRNAHQLAPPKPTMMNLSPNILLASKRTHAEGLTILYGENLFQAHPSYLASMLFALDPSRTVNSSICHSLIRRFHIRVRLDCDSFYNKEDVTRVFDGADVLEVEVFRSSWGNGGYEALEGYRDVRGVRKARVHGSLPAPTARWLESCMEGDREEAVEGWGCEEDEESYWDR